LGLQLRHKTPKRRVKAKLAEERQPAVPSQRDDHPLNSACPDRRER
jgi:hypothetical protein